jgi:HrpA-like RNA helicase
MKRKRPAAAPAAPATTPPNVLPSHGALPIRSARLAFLHEMSNSPTVILTGDTGCGKTTQIPQYLHTAGYGTRGMIGITQPRRVAAMSVAHRVAAEMGARVGELVGYCVRFDDCSGPRTRIRYLTDGMLLREALGDPLLSRYAVLVIDEAHERSLQTDVVLAILKAAQAARAAAEPPPPNHTTAAGRPPCQPAPPPLKLLVMSATLELDAFCAYFSGAPAVQVLGRAHPVQLMYVPEPQPDYVEAAVTTVLQLHVRGTATISNAYRADSAGAAAHASGRRGGAGRGGGRRRPRLPDGAGGH